MKYEKSYWDYGWFLLGIAACVYGVVTGVTESFWWGVPVILLAYKAIMQNRYIQELEDDNEQLMLENNHMLINEYPYVVSDSKDRDWSKPKQDQVNKK